MSSSPDPIVRFRDVTVRRGDVAVLDGIDFEVAAGVFLGIVGPNGAGKTTLLRALLGLLRVDSGSIEVLGRPAADRNRAEAHAIGYVPQRQAVEPTFPASVADVVMMGRICCMGPFRFPGAEDRRQVAQTLDRVGISSLAARPVGELSGGEQRRVLLAQALCASTRLLVLDEPTVGLDLPAEQEFYALLRELQRDLGLTILAVSHDLVGLAGEADRLICVNRSMHVHGRPEEVIHSHAIREAYSCEFDFLAGELERHGGKNHEH